MEPGGDLVMDAGFLDSFVLRMWRAGMDTDTMARRLALPEAMVADRLAQLLDERHRDQAELERSLKRAAGE